MSIEVDPALPETTDGADEPDGSAAEPIDRGSVVGRYTVLSVLGHGGMGRVYRAWDPALDRPVALKVMLAGRFAARRQITRFLDEARTIARLDHPALVAVHDVGVVDGCPFFTMEYVDGHSLAALLEVEGPRPARAAARIAAEVARGLAHAHGQGVVHRDIKPGNVLLDGDGAARVIDFGIARLLESETRTRTGQILGTPAYMAPEQAAGRADAVAPTVDVYGLGALLYTALTGSAPRAVDSGAALKAAAHPAIPRDLLAICNRALAAEPAERYPSAAALADDLERFLRGQPVEAALPGPVRRLGWWLRRTRRITMAIGVTALLLVGAAAALDHGRAQRAARAAAAEQARRDAMADERLTRALDESRALRAQGRVEQARRVEQDAALHPEVQRTRALARFHLARADDAAAAGAIERALNAASTAYAVAETPAQRHGAMLTLGALFVEQHDAAALADLLATMAERFPDRPARAAERARLALHGQVFAGRLAEAAALAETVEPDWAPLLRALARGIRTAHHLPGLSVTRDLRGPWLSDVTGDGRPELWTGDALLATDDVALPPVPWPAPPADLGPDARIRPIDGMPGVFATAERQPGIVLRRAGDGWRTLTTTARRIDDLIVAADLDGDRQAEIYTSTGPGMQTLMPGAAPGEPWRQATSDAALDGAEGYLKAIRVARWPTPHLVVVSGGWRAYDVRIYRGAGAGRLQLVARRQTGTVADAIVLPDAERRLIAVATRSPSVDADLFHPDDDRLLPDGVHILEWTADGVVHRHQVARGTGRRAHARMWAGDVDGDGRTDLVTLVTSPDVPRYTVVHRRLADGWAPPLPLLGFYPFGLVDVDGDGDVELLANDLASGQLWVVGAGDTPLPSQPPPAPLPAAGRDGAIADLVALGRLDAALQAWRREIRLGEQPAVAAGEAGRLAERLERYAEAAELYLRAADAPDQAAAMLAAAADAGRAARRPDLERAALTRLSGQSHGPGRQDAERRLAALDAAEAERVDFDFRGGLGPQWRLTVPDRLRVDRVAGALEVHGDPLSASARLPLRRTAERVAIELRMQTPRVEFGGGLTLALVAPRGDGGDVDLGHIKNHGWGGGTLVYQRIFADFGSQGQAVLLDERLDGVEGHPVHVHLEFDHRTGRSLVIDRRTGRRWQMTLDVDAVGAELALVIRHPTWVVDGGPFVAARITDLTLSGVRLGPASDDPLHVAALAVANGRFDDALSALGGRDDPPATAIRAAALYERGDWRAADGHLRAALLDHIDDVALRRFVIGRLRRDPLHFAPLVRGALGDRADTLFWRTWRTGFAKHRHDPDHIRAAGASLVGVDDDEAGVVDHPDPPARLGLWLTRARVRRAAGHGGGARADLDRITRALARLPLDAETAAATELRALRTATLLERAALDVVEDPQAAADSIREALARSPFPAITADRIRADDRLRRLAGQPVWAVVEAAAGR